jgi:hypothetical protein
LKSFGTAIEAVNSRIDEVSRSVNTRVDSANARIYEMHKRNTVLFDEVRNEIRGLSEKLDRARDVDGLKVEVTEMKRRRWPDPDSPWKRR